MWLVEALKEESEVTVITTGGWDLPALNAYYGTHIKENEVNVRTVPIPFSVHGLNAAALRGAFYQRFARKVAAEYDVRISAYNLTDWGLPAVHFIADFSWNRSIRDQLDPPSPGFIYRDTILRRAYMGMVTAFQNPSTRNVLRDDPVVANSHWSAGLLKRNCGVDCAAVIYPSVWTEFPAIPWEDKELAFVMIGRVAPEKQIEQAITILKTVRDRGHAIRLHLCGKIEGSQYGNRISQICRQYSDWIVPEGEVIGTRKSEVLARCQFGLQTRAAEPFGIAVAEMIKSGAIVFAPNDGGQAEILGHPDLLFSNVEDAVEKILLVLEKPALQTALRTHLMNQAKQFSAIRFVQEARAFISAMQTVAQFSSAVPIRRES
jgi:glycosyltransferase involved in cell wall biosynthesis